jgi:magnesium-transporting ATPase (P-type)
LRGEPFPADLILLNSSLPKGLCYIETKDLDGETNLKHKQSEKKLLELDMSSDEAVLNSMRGMYIECENPNDMLYRFEGAAYIKDIVAPLSVDQILLRGSVLKNTEYVYGLVVFTGHETKIMKNMVRSKSKFSKLERSLNMYMIVIVLAKLSLAFLSSIFGILNEYLERTPYVFRD